jgi:putative DNA primase/helicase
MGRVKESAMGQTGNAGRRRATPRHRAEDVMIGAQAAPMQSAQDGRVPQSRIVRAPADTASTVHPRGVIGDALYGLDDVPQEFKLLAQQRFGTPIRMGTPRKNGGPYRGEILNAERYLIQEVSARSVVFHLKDRMELVSERLRWMNENQRLNGAEVQIGYDGDRPKVYPWDRMREQFERTVASLKMSAREMGFGSDFEDTLERLQVSSWARIQQARAEALALSKKRAAREANNEPDR